MKPLEWEHYPHDTPILRVMNNDTLSGADRNVYGSKSIPYGQLIQQVLSGYPIKNKAWSHDEKTNMISTDASDFGSMPNKWLDPWNRPMVKTAVEATKNDEGEVLYWTTIVTIVGVHVELTIFND